MLSACESFRLAFDASSSEGRPDHAATCPACRRWVEELEASIASVRPAGAMSEALRRRLLALPGHATRCPGDAELAEAVAGGAEPALAEHLTTCARCAPIAAVLRAARGASPGQLPERLRADLVAIATPGRRVPVWLRWGDVGSLAASFLLTLALTLVAGDSAASLFRDPPVGPVEVGWVDEGRQRLREVWTAFADDAGAGWDRFSRAFERSVESWVRSLAPSRLSSGLPVLEIEPASSDNHTRSPGSPADPGDSHDRRDP